MRELSIAALAEQLAGFDDPQLGLVIPSIAAGNTAGRLWQIDDPPTSSHPMFLLWDKGNNVVYLIGRHYGGTSIPRLAELIATQIRPQMLAEERPYFKTRSLDPAFDAVIPELFPDLALRRLTMRLYRFETPERDLSGYPLSAGARLVPINRGFLADTTFQDAEPIKEEIAGMWPALERFTERGFGMAALLGQRVVCWCTAEYVSADACGIGIATSETERRKGLATATAAAFVQAAIARSLTPHWECNSTNIGSVRVAETLGFTLINENHCWAGVFT